MTRHRARSVCQAAAALHAEPVSCLRQSADAAGSTLILRIPLLLGAGARYHEHSRLTACRSLGRACPAHLSSVDVEPSRRRWEWPRISSMSWIRSRARVIWLNSSTLCPAQQLRCYQAGCVTRGVHACRRRPIRPQPAIPSGAVRMCLMAGWPQSKTEGNCDRQDLARQLNARQLVVMQMPRQSVSAFCAVGMRCQSARAS